MESYLLTKSHPFLCLGEPKFAQTAGLAYSAKKIGNYCSSRVRFSGFFSRIVWFTDRFPCKFIENRTGKGQAMPLRNVITHLKFWDWPRRYLPDYLDYAFSVLTALSALFLAISPLIISSDLKYLAAIPIAVFSIGSITAKTIGKAKDRREKEDKEKAEKEQEASREKRRQETSKRCIGVFLMELRTEFFGQLVGEDAYPHRVTLFEHSSAIIGTESGKFLILFARSGVHTDSTIRWSVDDSHPDRCRGIAGKTWYDGVTVIKVAVCDWPTDGNSSEKLRYAESLGATVAEVEALNVKSRTFVGVPVFVGNRKWGVLLLDSTLTINVTPNKKGVLNKSAERIGRMLEEIH